MLGEFDIIRRFFMPRTDHTVLAGGDDAALVALGAGMELAISTDALVAGRHFLEDADPYGVGWKSMAVNLSDMAAMGATPRWATLALSLPRADERWLESFARGFLELANVHHVDLIGGDTTSGPLMICVQIMGEVAAGRALRRSGARVGDDIWVSGTIGDAALALASMRGDVRLDADDLDEAAQRLNRPVPRVELGRALIGLASSAIDISDGLAADIGHIAEASGVRAVLHWESMPVSSFAQSDALNPIVRKAVLAGGDDYELAFTAPKDVRPRIEKLSDRLELALTWIGEVESGSGVEVVDQSGRPIVLTERGFDHFR